MATSKTYKELLERLSRGELSQTELWQLEKLSLDDPFLADALEGYHLQKGKDKNLSGLHQKINRAPIKTRKLSWRSLSVAASLLLLLGASYFMFNQNNLDSSSTAEKQVITETKKKIKTSPVAEADDNSNSTVRANESVGQKIEPPKKDLDLVDKSTSSDLTGNTKAKQEDVIVNKSQVEKRNSSLEQRKTESLNGLEDDLMDAEVTDADEEESIAYDKELAVNESKQIESAKDVDVLAEKEVVIEEATTPGGFGKNIENSTKKEVAESANNLEESNSFKSKRKKKSSSVVADIARVKKKEEGNISEANSIKGIVNNSSGRPLSGVNILDTERKVITKTDEQGAFVLQEHDGYIIAEFSGFESQTIPVLPELSVELAETKESFSEPHKRLVDMMTKYELDRYYVNKLNELFSRYWPLCSDYSRSWSQRNARNIISVNVVIADDGSIRDLEFFEDLDEQCLEKISNVFSLAEEGEIFYSGRPTEFRFRVKL